MAYEHKPGAFSLFPNDKGGNDKRPDWRGEGKDLAGNPIEIAAWTRQSSKGDFLSCSFKIKEARPEKEPETRSQPAKEKTGGAFDQMNDDIPFAPIGKGISGHAI
jgi:hypothetical protein